MNSFLKIDKLTKSLVGVLAMIATVALLGTPVTLAEYYAHMGAADHAAASMLADQAVRTAA